jgi:Zn finger protein HypA/HybF involved in hydrogenase expression
MGFTIEQDCPQCGGPVELDETDRLLRCPYCDVKSYLFAKDYYRYQLPNISPEKDIIYAPYLRFKGTVYFCKGLTIGHRIIDITHLGLELDNIPVSLGLRPQAMKMRFVTPETQGSFLKFSIKPTDILTKAGKLTSGSSGEQILHRAFIGETMSLIYLPMYIEGDRLFDGVLNRPIATLPRGHDDLESLITKNSRWKMEFIPTLCPQCGWTLEGERDSVVMTCSNCHSAWEVVEGKFVRVTLSVAAGQDKDRLYLPFWKISARAKGIEIESFSDFIRITNQPRVIDDESGKEVMSYWSPAFKIRPKLFLNLSRQLTVSQRRFQEEETISGKRIYPVTLQRSEAVQALKIILASSAVYKKNVLPHLPRISFEIKSSVLVFLPFTETNHDMIQQDMGISVNKQGIEFGRQL